MDSTIDLASAPSLFLCDLFLLDSTSSRKARVREKEGTNGKESLLSPSVVGGGGSVGAAVIGETAVTGGFVGGAVEESGGAAVI